MAAKISKDELATILKGIADKANYDDMQEAIEKIADEFGIDLTEVEEEDVELEDVTELMEDDLFRDPNDDDEEDY